MDRVERTGIGIAAAGHVALFAAFSLGLFAAKNKLPTQPDPIEVSFVDNIGLKSAAPQASAEAPAPSVAPEIAKPEDIPPPPQPKAAEPKPAAKPLPVAPTPAPDRRDRPRPDRIADAMQAVAAAAKAERKPTGRRLGADFLKGLSPEKSSGKANAQQAAAVSAQAMAGLAAAIARQVEPCLNWPDAGVDLATIITVLQVHFNQDGTIAGTPRVVDQTGLTSESRPYAAQMADAAKRAVIRCAPLRLPPQLYDVGGQGWNNIEFGLRKRE